MKFKTKYKISVSGSADTRHCPACAIKKAQEIGEEIVKQNGILVTGATTGIPNWAAIGTKKAKGMSIGISPAGSEMAHIKAYRLPIKHYDVIIYTGAGYAGRDILMTRASDAAIFICGRMGTLHEFTVAFESRIPIGVLKGTGGITDRIGDIMKTPHRKRLAKVIFETDPKKLVEQLIIEIKRKRSAM